MNYNSKVKFCISKYHWKGTSSGLCAFPMETPGGFFGVFVLFSVSLNLGENSVFLSSDLSKNYHDIFAACMFMLI